MASASVSLSGRRRKQGRSQRKRQGSRHFEHLLQGLKSRQAYWLGQFNPGCVIQQTQIDLLKSVTGHERTTGAVASAIGAGQRDEDLVRRGLIHLVNDVLLGSDDE